MDDELSMLLADLGSPEALADCIVENFKTMRIPVPVEEIAEAVGITEINGILSENFEGLLVTDDAKTKGCLTYNKASSVERQRFTIAHEVGHFLIPTHNASVQCAKNDMGVMKSVDIKKSKEAEANRFAACLLMPKRFYSVDMKKFGPPEIQHIQKLAEKYEVSREAAARRYTDLSEHCCAVIFSYRNLVKGFCKSSDFPFLPVKMQEALPSDCRSMKTTIGVGAVSDWADVNAETWMIKAEKNKAMYEQFLQQEGERRLTMLTLDAVDETDDEDEEAIEHAWAPPRFRR